MGKASEHYSEDCGLEPHSGASQPGAATGQGGVGWCGGREGVPPSSCLAHMAPASSSSHDSLAEWSKALASGASPQGRGLEPHSCRHAHHHHRSPPPHPPRWRRPWRRRLAHDSGKLVGLRLYSAHLCLSEVSPQSRFVEVGKSLHGGSRCTTPARDLHVRFGDRAKLT